MATPQKITYTSADVDMTEFHRLFDEALAQVKKDLGKTYPLWIGGEEVYSDAEPIVDVSPIDTGVVLGKFQAATPAQVDQAVRAAKAAQKGWRKTPWQERVRIIRKAANLIRERKYHIAALMALEVGKNRMESIGDVEESADLLDYYAGQMEDAQGYSRIMNRVTTTEDNTEVLLPYGVFACVAPFNFPGALAFGMSSATLVAGNAVVFKPAKDTPWTGLKLYEVYRDAGVPAGVFNYLTGRGADVGDNLVFHEQVDGVVFTGSKEVGMHIFHGLSKNWIKPALLEMGGKNPTIVMPTADVEMAAEGVMKSAWGLQGQKCSACSRVYVHKDVAAEFVDKLIEKTKGIKIGDPTEQGVYLGPVINKAAVDKFERAAEQAKKDGEILYGGGRITDGAFAKGHYVQPTIVKVPKSSSLLMEELFVPFLSICEIESLDEAIEESNKAEYGLTAGIYSAKQEEIDTFFDEIEAGVTYVNKRTGATTGAWPGAQAFCGWKGSGATGKGGCGPWYVSQFMREQSRTIITEK